MYDIYHIKPSDTLDNLASRYNVNKEVLYQINGSRLDNDFRVGNDIIVPKMNNPYFDTYTIKSGDTLMKVAREYNIDYRLLAQLNGLNTEDYIYPNQNILIPKEGVQIYITAEGDTLLEVASGLNANLGKLLYQNNKLYLMPDQIIVYKEN